MRVAFTAGRPRSAGMVALRRLTAGLVAMAVLLAFVVPGSSGGAATHRDFAPHELMRGIFFGVGPVAQRLSPDLAARPETAKGSPYDRVTETLLAKVNSIDPKFAPQFANAVNAGDYVAIRAGLERGKRLIEQASNATFPQGGNSGAADHRMFVFGPLVVVVAAVLAVVAAAVVVLGAIVVGNVFITVQKVVTTYQFASKLRPSTLQRERLVSKIVTELAR
jgi:SdpC family antimicrobial peptide